MPAPISTALAMPTANGSLVVVVTPGLPAELAGVMAGDVLLTFDGRPTNTPTDLAEAVMHVETGRSIRITVWRQGAELPLTVQF